MHAVTTTTSPQPSITSDNAGYPNADAGRMTTAADDDQAVTSTATSPPCRHDCHVATTNTNALTGTNHHHITRGSTTKDGRWVKGEEQRATMRKGPNDTRDVSFGPRYVFLLFFVFFYILNKVFIIYTGSKLRNTRRRVRRR